MLTHIANQLNYQQYLIHSKSVGDNLWGMEFDIVAYICDEKVCFHVEHYRLDNSNLMLVLTCKFKRGYNFFQIAEYLEQKWLTYICYPVFERHHIEVIDTTLYFYYVTRGRAGYKLGVTGVIIVE